MKFKVFDVQNVAVAYVCLWATSPFLAYGLGFRLAAAAAVGLWVLLEMFRPGGIFARPTFPVVLSLFYASYTALVELLLGDDGSIINHVQLWVLLFFLIFYESRRHDVRSMSPIFWFMLATLPIWFFTTYAAFDTFGAHAARHLTRSSELARELTSDGVGGYSLVYGVVLLMPVLVLMALNVRRFVPLDEPRFLRPLSRIPYLVHLVIFANLVLGFAVVVRAGFSIAIVLTIFSVLVSLAFKRRSLLMLTLMPLLMVLSWLFFQFAFVPVLEALLPLTEGTSYYRKIVDVIDSIEGDQSQGSLDERVSRYTRSIDLFMSNPIFGVLSIADVGKHSSYLDSYARYGILIGSTFVYLLTYLPLRMMRGMRDNFGLALSVLVIMILMPLLNNAFASLGVVLFVMVPVACGLVERARTRLPSAPRRWSRIRWTLRPDPVGHRSRRLTGPGGGRA